jgi:hypothetical protein
VEPNTFSADVPANSYVGRWMTHDELAAVRGIDRSSAVRLALRHGWHRQRDKQRVLRVLVPAEWLNQVGLDGAPRGAETGTHAAPGTGSFDAVEQARRATAARATRSDEARTVERSMWQERVAHERERAEIVEQERTRLLSIIEDLETRIAAIEARADAAGEDRRLAEARADAAVSRAIAAEGDRRSAEARADAERVRADVLDKSLTSERARAEALRKQMDVAEGALAAERGDAEALRKRMNELKELLAGVVRAQNPQVPSRRR